MRNTAVGFSPNFFLSCLVFHPFQFALHLLLAAALMLCIVCMLSHSGVPLPMLLLLLIRKWGGKSKEDGEVGERKRADLSPN